MSYSQNQLKTLAQNNPKELIRILTSTHTDVSTLTFGAELLGEAEEQFALPTLKQLLKHVNAVVRESAMMGLSSLYIERKPPQEIMEKLQVMSKTDPSPNNKEFAEILLKGFEVLL